MKKPLTVYFLLLTLAVHMDKHQVRNAFELLRDKLAKYEASPMERLNFISWLDSKIENVPVKEVIRRKTRVAGRRNYS